MQRFGGARARLARNRFGQQSNAVSSRPTLGYSGSAVLFDSDATTMLGEGFDPNPGTGLDVYRRSNPLSPDALFISGFE